MSFTKTLVEYVNAGFSGIWIQSFEHEDAVDAIRKVGAAQPIPWKVGVWDVAAGMAVDGNAVKLDPLGAIGYVHALNEVNRDITEPELKHDVVVVLKNYHMFVNQPVIIQALANTIAIGKSQRYFLVVLSPVVKIPMELEKQFQVIHHELPDRTQLDAIARSIATGPDDIPEHPENLWDSAAGLTRYEAEGAFSLSLARHNKLVPESIWEIKTASLKKSGLLSLHRGGERFSDVCGMEGFKRITTNARSCTNPKARPRGVLLLGVPGTGKSLSAKALGNEWGIPTICLDVGKLMGGLVGSTEANLRAALDSIDQQEPAIVFIDEIEKSLAGAQSSGQTDSGVMARVFGGFMQWMQDHTSNIYLLATANNLGQLIDFSSGAFVRAGRWDAIMFADLPGREEKDQAWKMYKRHFDLDAKEPIPMDADWTPAEIKQCCLVACQQNLSLEKSARMIVPTARTAAESIEQLRNWADGKVLSASTGETYTRSRSVQMAADTPAVRVRRK